LEKDPRHRLQTARDVSNEFRDLARQTSQKVVPAKTSTTRGVAPADSGAARADEGFWVAVLPFKYSGGNADIGALADGLSEDIVTGLSRFSYLRVIARSSTLHYANQSVDVRSAGKELGARYVMEGSLRQAGTKLRLAVQLVDTVSGAHLWAENYERTLSPENIFALQDDLVPRIVSTVADQHGILPRRISEELRGKNEEDLTPHEAVLRSFSFLQRISPTEHATARRILERAMERDPNQADAWAMLAIMYDTEFADEYNPRPNPLERAMAAAQRAVDLAPTHALGYYALAFTYFFRKDNAGFRAAVEQAIALNPMDGSVMGLLGLLVHHAGEIERGTQMVEAAMQLNPHYPPVFRAPAFLNAYAQGKYAEALELAVRFNMPGFFHAHALRAAALGQLGQREAAQQAVQELLAVRPDFATTVRRDYGKWWDTKTVDHLVEGLREAGLEIPDADSKPAPSEARPPC
jgi:TolB-like protein/Flp pilus assembly protein TadD